MSNHTTLSPEDIYQMYQKSVVCPCFPGDSPIQKRFFYTIINGCLPVVLKFPPTKRVSLRKETYWHPWGVHIERIYPYFSAPSFSSNSSTSNTTTRTGAVFIDCESIHDSRRGVSSQWDGRGGYGSYKVSNPKELRRLQLLLKVCTTL